MRFNKNLDRLLRERQWTSAHLVAALADRGIQTTQWSVDRWVNGRNLPRLEVVPDIAAALDVSVDDLFAEEAHAS